MEDILALLLVFGGGTLVAISFSPVGRALAERLRGRNDGKEVDPALVEEVVQLRQDVAELQERLDFAERMLTQSRQVGELHSGE